MGIPHESGSHDAHHGGHEDGHPEHEDHAGHQGHGDHAGQSGHAGHSGHAGYSGHGDHVAMFRRLFWVMLAFGLPVVVFSDMFAMILGYDLPDAGWVGWEIGRAHV